MIAQKIANILFFAINLLNVSREIVALPKPSTTSANQIEELIKQNVSAPITDPDSEYRAQYAQKMLTYMNQTVDPCDDFYEYACGNYKNVIEERDSNNERSNVYDIQYTLLDIVEKLLQKGGDAKLELNYASELKLARQYFNACLAADLYPMKRSHRYLEVINSIGGFPALNESWSTHASENFSWFNMSAHLTNYGVFSLVLEEIIPEYPFPIYFKQPELGFGYTVNSENIATNTSQVYILNKRRMHDYLSAYDVSETKIPQIIADVFEFWRSVLEVSDRYGGDFDQCLDQPYSTDKAFEQWPNYFDIAWSANEHSSITFGLGCEFFYRKLDAICNERKETVANYLAMKFLHHMDAKLKDAKFQKEHCIRQSTSSFMYLIDKLYLSEYFKVKVHDEIATIVNELRKSLISLLQQADWVDADTRAGALEIESSMMSRIGRYEESELEERLIREINTLTFVNGVDNYDQNNMDLKKFQARLQRYSTQNHGELKNTTKSQKLILGLTINAANFNNIIHVFAGILHPPVYHRAWPYALKFGALGNLVGHELTHSFESKGGGYYDNKAGVYRWWEMSQNSSDAFEHRVDCFIDHYNSYVIPEINRNIDGRKTMIENIADSGGIRQSLNAYRRYTNELKKNGESTFVAEEMPGLNLSSDQMYFLAFAQAFCSAYKEEHYWEGLADDHTINKYRILGTLTNFDEFAKVYECPLGSKMNNKSEKCRLW